jgi:hypothetical protein
MILEHLVVLESKETSEKTFRNLSKGLSQQPKAVQSECKKEQQQKTVTN